MTLESLCREFILDIEQEALSVVPRIPGLRLHGLSEKRRIELSRDLADLFRVAACEAVNNALAGYKEAS